MIRTNKKLFYIMSNIIIICSIKFSFASKDFNYDDVYHHNNTHIACFRKLPTLSKMELDHFIEHHLKRRTHFIDFSNQKKIDDPLLEKLADSSQAYRINRLDLQGTKISYDGILYLWKSLTFGSVRDDDPIYECTHNKPISIINIEIGNTVASSQYQKMLLQRKKIFPLPLRKKFEISYICPSGKHIAEKASGFKEINILIHGKLIE